MENKGEEISEQGKNFTLYTVYEDERIYSKLEVFTADGKIIVSEECFRPIIIRQISNDIVEIDVHVGTGMSDIRYCDVARGIVSKTYYITHPFLVVDNIIAYCLESGQELKLAAQDIFDEKRYYKEFVVDSESCATLIGLETKNDNEIEVKYAEGINSGDSYQEVEKITIFSLKD